MSKKKSLIVGFCIYLGFIFFAVINVGFRIDSNMIFYQEGTFIGKDNDSNWTEEYNPRMYPVIIQDKVYYYPLNTNLSIAELDGAKVKFSGKIIERIPPSLGLNFTQVFIKLTYIETTETLSILELSLMPIFLIIPMSIFLLLDFLGER